MWKKGNGFRIDNDLKSINTNYYIELNKIFFDVLQDMVVTAEMNCRFCLIKVRDLKQEGKILVRHQLNNHIEFADRGSWYYDPLSLCFHHGISPWLLSVFCQSKREGSEGVSEQSELMLFKHQSDELVPTTIKIPQEISLIQKHEYIGANTFLLLVANKLFFGVYDNDTQGMIFSKQKILTQKEKEWQEFQVLSFSANQDENKKTSAGRARYFALVVQEPFDDKSEFFQKKLLLCDLLNPTNTLLKIWQADFNEQNVDFDRISFGNDTLSLWNDDWRKKDAMKIGLEKKWDNSFEFRLLISFINKKGKLALFKQSLKTYASFMQAFDAKIDKLRELCTLIMPTFCLESLLHEEKRKEKRCFRLRVILSACFFVAICCLIFKLRQLSTDTIY